MPLPTLPNVYSILEVVLRLRDNAHVFNRNVGGGLEFDADKIGKVDADKHLPYAFVVPIDTVGKEIVRSECYQSREGIIGIVMCVDGSKHKAQGDGNNPVETVHSFSPLIEAVEDCLLRWRPTGFVLDDIPTFQRLHPLGATSSRAYVMLEYAIPYRFYHIAYGGTGLMNADTFQTNNPDYRAAKLKELLVHYKAEGEFPTVVGMHYYDNIPLPIPQPSEEVLDTFREESEVFDINQKVLDAIEDRRLGALNEVPQPQDVPFNHAT